MIHTTNDRCYIGDTLNVYDLNAYIIALELKATLFELYITYYVYAALSHTRYTFGPHVDRDDTFMKINLEHLVHECTN